MIKNIGPIKEKLHLKIPGNHNIKNAIMALEAAENIDGIDLDKAICTVNSFKGLPHRLEYIATINNVRYYNDSIATVPTAAITALEAFHDAETLILRR